MLYLKSFLVTFVVFMVIDLIWLGVVAKNLYAKYLGYIMTDQINWAAALVFYVVFIIGMLFFVIHPALAKDSLKYAFMVGAFYGFITYATYDLTNLATLKDWPLTITAIDLVWGTTLSTLTAGISTFLLMKIG